jgi:hypothetical protein
VYACVHVCMWMYVCMYVYACVYVYARVYVFLCLTVFSCQLWMHVCTCMHVCLCMHVRVCMCVCMCECMFMCVCVVLCWLLHVAIVCSFGSLFLFVFSCAISCLWRVWCVCVCVCVCVWKSRTGAYELSKWFWATQNQYSRTAKRILAGEMIHAILTNFDAVLNHTAKALTFLHFSAHDTTVMPLLIALEVFDGTACARWERERCIFVITCVGVCVCSNVSDGFRRLSFFVFFCLFFFFFFFFLLLFPRPRPILYIFY